MSRKPIRQLFGLLVAISAMMVMMWSSLAVRAQDDSQTTEVEIVGEIVALNIDSIAVNGLVIDISSAEINTSLELGKVVKIEGYIDTDGSIIARQVDDPAPDDTLPDEAEFVGTLTESSGDSMTIAGIVFDVSSAEIGAGVEVGERVKVHAQFTVENTWQAREVKLVEGEDQSPKDQPEDELALVGTLEAITDTSITVSGQVISIIGAEIKDELLVGVLVKVHATLVDGEWVAREVELFSIGDDDRQGIPADCVPTQPAGWTSYTIRAGDTLSDIAERAGSSQDELARANCIRDTRVIIAGVSIFVPREPVPASNDNNDNGGNDNGDDNNGNDDNGNDDNGNGNDDNGNDDNGNDDNGGNGNSNDDDHGNDND